MQCLLHISHLAAKRGVERKVSPHPRHTGSYYNTNRPIDMAAQLKQFSPKKSKAFTHLNQYFIPLSTLLWLTLLPDEWSSITTTTVVLGLERIQFLLRIQRHIGVWCATSTARYGHDSLTAAWPTRRLQISLFGSNRRFLHTFHHLLIL